MQNDRIESLTNKELKRLTELLSGYGSITDAANATGLHHQTIRLVRKLGYGKPETIAIIREKLLNDSKVTA